MEGPKYYAHTAKDASGKPLPESSGRWQPLKDHLQNVAALARRFAEDARPGDTEFAKAAYSAGLVHNLLGG